jgi:tetratricopeptide (TPR) repeat protein
VYEAVAFSALEAARAAGDTRTEARARTSVTNVHLVAGRYEEADEQAEQAAELARVAQDPAPVYWSDNDRGIIAFIQGRNVEAEEHLRRAKEGSRADGNLPGEASALCNLSRIYVAMGRTAQGIALAEEGITIYDRIGHTLRLANARYALGVALTQAGRHADALEQLAEALERFQVNRQRLWEGTAHFRIAQTHLAARRPANAAQHAEQALAIGFIGGDRTRANVLITLGKALDSLGQADRARACWREALALHEQLGAAEAAEVRGLLSPLSAA